MTEFPRHLRYSPVNYLIVNWGFNGRAFNDCGLPEPRPCPSSPDQPLDIPQGCCGLPIQEAIDTTGWAKWLPEVIVGIEDPDEEIAANYVRQAAIEFATYTRVLQRQILIPLQSDVCVYPVEPYDGERIVGVIGAGADNLPACQTGGSCLGYTPQGVNFTLDVARNELHLSHNPMHDSCTCGCKVLRLLVWSAPTEDACAHDRFLYDAFRREITMGARIAYAQAYHFRDPALMNSLNHMNDWELAKARAKDKAVSRPSSGDLRDTSRLWTTGGAW